MKPKKGCIFKKCEYNEDKKLFANKENFCSKCGNQLVPVCKKCFKQLTSNNYLYCATHRRENKDKVGVGAKIATGVVTVGSLVLVGTVKAVTVIKDIVKP